MIVGILFLDLHLTIRGKTRSIEVIALKLKLKTLLFLLSANQTLVIGHAKQVSYIQPQRKIFLCLAY